MKIEKGSMEWQSEVEEAGKERKIRGQQGSQNRRSGTLQWKKGVIGRSGRKESKGSRKMESRRKLGMENRKEWKKGRGKEEWEKGVGFKRR